MVFILLISCLVLILFLHHIIKRRNYPPGPPTIPLLGSFPFLENKKDILSPVKLVVCPCFYKYGDIFRLELGLRTAIVINDFKLAKEVFNKDEFSYRSDQTWINKYMHGDGKQVLGVIHSGGKLWREHRRFSLKHLRNLGFGKQNFDYVIQQEAENLIAHLLHLASYGDVLIDNTFNVPIINVLWKMIASSQFDPDDTKTKQIMNSLNRVMRNGPPIQILAPILYRILPLPSSVNELMEIRNLMREIIKEHMETLDVHNPRDFIDIYLTEMANQENGDMRSSFSLEDLSVICFDLFQAGAETTSTTLLWVLMYLALYPEVQSKCQKEIDKTIGGQNPSIRHMSKLPFCQATIMEIQRCSKTVPLSLQHHTRNGQPEKIRNYTIPKNAMILANIHKFLSDPNVFKDPEKFNPNRFYNEKLEQIIHHEQFIPFGVGKRICMGETLAKSELFTFFVMICQRLDIYISKNPDRKPSLKNFTSGVTYIPMPYYLKIKERIL